MADRGGSEAELAYARSVELLRQSDDLVKTVAGLLRRVCSGDGPLQWCILHVLGDAGEVKLSGLQRQPMEVGGQSLDPAYRVRRTMGIHALGFLPVKEGSCESTSSLS